MVLPRAGAVGFELNLERKVGFYKSKRDKKVLSRQAVFQRGKSELRASGMNKDKQSQGLEFRIIPSHSILSIHVCIELVCTLKSTTRQF